MKSLDKTEGASSAATGDNNGFFTPNEKIDFSNVKIEPMFEEEVDFDTFSKSDFRAVKVKACEAVKKSKKLLQFTLDDGTGTDRIILSGIHAYYEPEEVVKKTLIAILGNSLFRVHYKHHRKRSTSLYGVVRSIYCRSHSYM